MLHDTFAREGQTAFPGLPYLAPKGFAKSNGLRVVSLESLPAEWTNELEILALDGIPRNQEYVFFHRSSRTLIVCDVLFHFGPNQSAWGRFFARHVMRLRHGIGMSAFFRLLISDRAALARSIQRMIHWDFDRVIVGHADVVETDAKQRVARATGDA
jgi:hypothetical protein